MPPSTAKACACCAAKETSQQAPLKLCSACRTVRYCSTTCQKSHWQAHKAECKRLKAEEATEREELFDGLYPLTMTRENRQAWYDILYQVLKAPGKRAHALLDAFCAHGGDINISDPKNGWTLLHSVARDDNVAAIRFLVAKGADINARTRQEQSRGCVCTSSSPLHLAAIFGCNAAIAVLAELGADLEQQNHTGETPLLAAKCDAATLEALASKGANVRATARIEEAPAANLLDWQLHNVFVSNAAPPPRKIKAVVKWCRAHGIRESREESALYLQFFA